jgi:hypothetical protein
MAQRGTLVNRPLDEILTYAERSYVRMQAEQLIKHCIDIGDSKPFDQLLEGLVLAGASSLGVMREIQEELRATKSALSQEGLGVRQDLMDAFEEFGVHLPALAGAEAPEAFRRICNLSLGQEALKVAPILDAEDAVLLREICSEAAERVTSIARRMALLSRLDRAVRDWTDGLAYQAVRLHEGDDSGNPRPAAPPPMP